MRRLAPWIRRFVAKSHIGNPCLTTSTSICAQNVAAFSGVSRGIHGTSTSSRMPTSASATCLPGTKPAAHGESAGMLRWSGLNSNTRMPANRATSSRSAGVDGSRPAYAVTRSGFFAAISRSASSPIARGSPPAAVAAPNRSGGNERTAFSAQVSASISRGSIR